MAAGGFVDSAHAAHAVCPAHACGGLVAAAGIRIISSQKIDRKATLVMALSFAFGLSVELVPEILGQLPETVRNIFSSGITTGGLTAILANLLIRIDE